MLWGDWLFAVGHALAQQGKYLAAYHLNRQAYQAWPYDPVIRRHMHVRAVAANVMENEIRWAAEIAREAAGGRFVEHVEKEIQP